MVGFVSVDIPRSLYEEARRRGINVEGLILDVLISELKLDPKEAAEARLELAGKYLKEAREFLRRGNSIQASEKIYKVVEECVKALAEYYRVPELREVCRRGRWLTWLLGSAARTLAKRLGEPRIEYVWAVAYDIHVWGFNEARYGVDKVRMDIQHVEWLLNYAKQKLKL